MAQSPKARWIVAILKEAAKPQPVLPWTRGKRTGSWKANLDTAQDSRKTSTA